MVLPPVFSESFSAVVDQVVHAPVGSNETVATVDPLTIRFAGRALPVPLAKRTASVAGPDAGAFAVTWA